MKEAGLLQITLLSSRALQPEELVLLTGPGQRACESVCFCWEDSPQPLAVGSYLGLEPDRPLLQVESACWLPSSGSCRRAYWLRVLSRLEASSRTLACRVWKQGYSLARISLSDSGARGERRDRSGPRISELVQEALPLCLELAFVLPDDLGGCKALLSHLALELQTDLILTTGGTGVTSRDLAPEATSAVLERRLPGFEQAMLAASLAKTPHAVISRAKAGILGTSLIVNLPGSRKAVEENLAAVLPAFKHTLDKIRDDPTECGRS